MGYWLLIIPLLLAPLAFRKNLLLSVLPIILVINLSVATPEARAAGNSGADESSSSTIQTVKAAVTEQSEGWSVHWNNLWRTPDQQAGGEQSQDQQTQDQQQLAAGEQAQDIEGQNKTEAQPADGRNTFQKAMDELLSGNGDMADASDAEQPEDKGQPIAARGYSEQDQAIEQQLRAVPDDLSGLLRARIHQHYAQQRADRS